jgi:hypothetical protein
MAIYGDNLVNAIRPKLTYYEASGVAGKVAQALLDSSASFNLLDNYRQSGVVDTANLAVLRLIDPASAKQLKAQLDADWAQVAALELLFIEVPDDSVQIKDDERTLLLTQVKIASLDLDLADKMFHTSVLDTLVSGVVGLAGDLTGKIAAGAGNILGNFFGGTWWIWAGAGAGLILYIAAVRASAQRS